MANIIMIIKKAEMKLENNKVILRLDGYGIENGETMRVEMSQDNLKTLLAETGKSELSEIESQLVVADTSTYPALYIKGLNKDSLIV